MRYGPKSYPIFRIQRLSISFNLKKINKLTKKEYRINELKNSKK